MKVTKIAPQKSRKRVNVYIDGKYGFPLDIETYVKSGIKIDQELVEEDIKKLTKTSSFATTLEKLIMFSTLRPRSEFEVKSWMKRKHVPDEQNDDLIAKLRYLDLLSDSKFARWWVEQRQSFKPMGLNRLRLELRGKGIDTNTIDDVLMDFNSKDEQIKYAVNILRKKIERSGNLIRENEKQKIIQFLMRRGFSYEVIKSAIDEMEGKR